MKKRQKSLDSLGIKPYQDSITDLQEITYMKKEKKEKFLGLRLTKAQLKILEEVTDLYNKENSTELNVQDMIRLMLTKGCDVLKQG